MSDTKILHYLFTAEFADGSTFEQTPEDKSTLDETRNCYYDVLQSGKQIVKWTLKGKGNTVSVDLRTGLFNVNGLDLILESKRLPCLPDKFDLVWYHQVTKEHNITTDNNTGQVIKVEEMPEFREYFIGWRCVVNGKEYEQKLAVA